MRRIIAGLVLLMLAASLWLPGQQAFGQKADTAQLRLGGAVFDIQFDAKPSPILRKATLDWITRAANSVTLYYLRFPVPQVDVYVHITPGRGVSNGRAWGNSPRVRVAIGASTTEADLTGNGENWVMVHELLHLAFPSVEAKHHWMEEGLSTYVEPIARVRSGELKAADVWKDMIEQMPKGQPEEGDRGLNLTPTWGRTYWGGAIFCLLADVEIRKKTHNRFGLETALRGVVAKGGIIDEDWPLAQALATGDQALGTPVLKPLYESMKDRTTPVDLQVLWQQLGIEYRQGTIIFHDEAPLADIRKAIMPQLPEKPEK